MRIVYERMKLIVAEPGTYLRDVPNTPKIVLPIYQN